MFSRAKPTDTLPGMDGPAQTEEDAEAPPEPSDSLRHGATRKQVRGSSLLLVGRILSLAVNFVVQILIVRYLTKADFGAFAYALSLVALGQSIITFGLDRAITRFIPIYEERKEYDKVFGTIVMVVGTILSLGLALIALTFGLQSLISGPIASDQQTITLILILVFLVPIQAIDGLQTGMFAVFSKPKSIFFRKYVLAPGFRLTVALLVVFGGKSVVWLAVGTVIAGAAGAALYSVLLYSEIKKRGLLEHFHFSSMQMPAREVFTFTVPLLSSDLLYTVMNTSDAILVGHFDGATGVGALRVIGPAAQMNQIVLASFSLLFTPLAARMFARHDRQGINEVYWGTAVWTAVVSFPIFALTFSLAQTVTVTLYGARYESSAVYLALLSFGYFFQAALGFNGLTLKVYGLLRYIFTINILAMLANLALNFALIPIYGPLGAAIGTTATLVVHNLFKQWGLRRAGVDIFEWRFLRIYVSIALGAGVLLLIEIFADPPFVVALVLAGAASLAVFLVNRHLLEVSKTFPELLRFRAVRLLFRQ